MESEIHSYPFKYDKPYPAELIQFGDKIMLGQKEPKSSGSIYIYLQGIPPGAHCHRLLEHVENIQRAWNSLCTSDPLRKGIELKTTGVHSIYHISPYEDVISMTLLVDDASAPTSASIVLELFTHLRSEHYADWKVLEEYASSDCFFYAF